jgi:hypothetical protein
MNRTSPQNDGACSVPSVNDQITERSTARWSRATAACPPGTRVRTRATTDNALSPVASIMAARIPAGW